MKLRSPLKTGGAVGLGVFALSAVNSGTAFAAGAGGANSPMGWAPMPDPADGTVVSPPFSPTLTVGERAHLEIFDELDFDVFSHHDWERLSESHAQNIRVHWPDGHYTDGSFAKLVAEGQARRRHGGSGRLGPRMCGSRSTLCE